ncbi:MAG: tetratricopeptide repeat protein [Polyangiaceae bacterium]
MTTRLGSTAGGWLLAASLSAASWCVTLPAGAEQEAPEPALELHDEARELYARGDYAGAVDKLREAVRLDPDAKTLFYNLGLIEEKMGRIDAALADYKRCLELETNPDERANLALVIKRLEGAREAMSFGPAPLPAPAPPPPPAPTDDGVSPWVWVTGATALSSFIAAAVLASRAGAVDPGDDATTNVSTPLEQLEADAAQAHQLALGADIALGIGIAATAATIVIALVTTGDDGDTPVAVGIGPTAATMRVDF